MPPSSRLTRLSFAAALDSDPGPDRGRAGEGDAGHVGIVDERLADVRRRAGDDVDHAGRKVRHRGCLAPAQAWTSGVSSARLDDDGVAGGERGRDLPHHEQAADS